MERNSQKTTQQAAQAPGPRPQALRSRRGFSLVEIMVVVVIIGLLAGAVTLKVGGYLGTAKQSRVKSDLATIKKAVESYYMTHMTYPSVDQGIDVLPIDNKADPWGNKYIYNRPASRSDAPFEVYTLGEDGRQGGEGPNADVYSWQLEEGQE